MKFVVIVLPPKIRKDYTENAIGQTTCPICKQDNIKVMNDNGPTGNENFNYLENHYQTKDRNDLCFGSEQILTSSYFDEVLKQKT